MKHSWLLLAGWLIAGAAQADSPAADRELSACGHGQEREIKGERARTSTLQLTSIQPVDNSYVTAKSMVVAELEYDIARFAPGMYQVNAQFKTIDAHATQGGQFYQFPELQYAHGTLKFCYPLHAVWSQPDLKWPLGLVFNLTHRNDDGSVAVIASSGLTTFNSSGIPAAVLNRVEPGADQVANREAVEKLTGFFETVQVHVGMCMEKFPALKSSLQSPLDDWNKRYQALREKSDNLYLDFLRHRYPGSSRDQILVILEARRTALVRALQSVPDALSKRNCGLMPGRFADGTYDPAKAQPQAVALVNRIATR
jgi:hypothetical protein